MSIAELNTKTLEENFRDWEGHVFGYGYGTGEPLILPALKKFMDWVPTKGCYDYQTLEREVGGVQAWLFINILARAHVLEYGSSPRFAWLTEQGKALKAFMEAHSADELVTIATDYTENYVHCYPDACNCGPRGYEKWRICINPFWRARHLTQEPA